MATLNVGTLTKKMIHANHSDMVDAKEPRTTLQLKQHVNINARTHLYKNVSLIFFIIDSIDFL